MVQKRVIEILTDILSIVVCLFVSLASVCVCVFKKSRVARSLRERENQFKYKFICTQVKTRSIMTFNFNFNFVPGIHLNVEHN